MTERCVNCITPYLCDVDRYGCALVPRTAFGHVLPSGGPLTGEEVPTPAPRVRAADDFDAIRANMERLRREEGRQVADEKMPDGRPTPPADTYIGCFPVDPEWCPF